MVKRWKILAGVVGVVALLMAQQPVTITQSSNQAVVKAASTAAVAADPALVVSLSPNSPLPGGNGSAVIGAVAESGGPWTFNLTQLDGNALGAPSNYGTSPGAVAVAGVNAYVTNTVPISLAPSTSSGASLSTYHVVSSTSTYNTAKASAGALYGFQTTNPNNSPCWLVFYNSTSPTVGTTAIVAGFEIQAGTPLVVTQGTFALAAFSTGITFATTTTDGGASVCGTGLSTNVFYE